MVSEAMCKGKGCFARPGNLSSEGLCERCSPGATRHFTAPTQDLDEVLKRLETLETTVASIKEWFSQERSKARRVPNTNLFDTVTTPVPVPDVHYSGCGCIQCMLHREGR